MLAPKKDRKFYVGVGLSTVSYMLPFSSNSNNSNMRTLGGSIEPVVFPHIGYRLTPRLNVQVGVGYGKDNLEYGSSYFESQEDEENGIVTFETVHNNTKGWAVPVTVEFTPFNPHKRLQLYVTASIVPTYGSNYHDAIRRRGGSSTVLKQDEGSGFNTFFIGGLLLKYRINNRLDAYLEGNLLYKHLGKQSDYADSKPKSLGLGLNYKL